MKVGKSTEIGNKIDIAIWICHHPKSGRNEARINIYRKRATTSLSYQMNGIWLFLLFFFLLRSSNSNTHSPNITFAIPHQQKSKEEEKKRKKIFHRKFCLFATDESLEILLEFHNFGFGFRFEFSSEYLRKIEIYGWLFDGDFLHNCEFNRIHMLHTAIVRA